jgi:hypothetical protein
MHLHYCSECKEHWLCRCEDYADDYELLCDECDPDVSWFGDPEFIERIKKGIEESESDRA